MQTNQQKRKRYYIFLLILLILAWYVLTGLESWQMGIHPLARRPFTAFDTVLFMVLVAGFINLHWWYGKCPNCGKRMQGQLDKHCRHCHWGDKHQKNKDEPGN